MNGRVAALGLVALLIGALVGFLVWGVPTRRLQTELGESRTRAERLEQELGELRSKTQQLQAHLEVAEKDLSSQKEMNYRLQMLVSQGKK